VPPDQQTNLAVGLLFAAKDHQALVMIRRGGEIIDRGAATTKGACKSRGRCHWSDEAGLASKNGQEIHEMPML